MSLPFSLTKLYLLEAYPRLLWGNWAEHDENDTSHFTRFPFSVEELGQCQESPT